MSQRRQRIHDELAETRSYLVSIAGQVGPEQALNSTENPLWNIHDLLAHLAVAERGLQATVKRFLAGEALPEGFSLDYWNERQVGKLRERAVPELLASLEASRQETLALLDGLSDEQLAVRGVHPAGFETSVGGVFRVMARHERAHGQEIALALGIPVDRRESWAALP
jgi:uncharacterized protein (TIGR03083 family)